MEENADGTDKNTDIESAGEQSGEIKKEVDKKNK